MSLKRIGNKWLRVKLNEGGESLRLEKGGNNKLERFEVSGVNFSPRRSFSDCTLIIGLNGPPFGIKVDI